MKRVFVLLLLVFYTASAFAAVPWLPARVLHHDGVAAAVTEHHDCDEASAADANAAVAVAINPDETCADCARGFSPCCTGMFALTTGIALPLLPPAVADRTPLITTVQLASRGDSIYRPPRG